jgi:ketosteroid isomerase-like protein
MPEAVAPGQKDTNTGPPGVAGISDPVKGSTDEQALTNARVEQFLASQLASFRDVGAFVDAFADTAIVFFPGSLTPYEGTTQIANGFREAWGPASAHTEITTAPATIGIGGSAALVTTEWRVVYGTTMSFRVRVTEMIESRADSIKIVAAHFSTPPRKGTSSLGEPVPMFPAGSASTSGGILVTSPIDLATMVHDSAWTSAIGSDESEVAIGADAARKMLGTWKKVNLELVGNARIIEGSGYRTVFAFARWRTSKPTLFRVLGIFVRGSGMATPGPWELASVHYSVALSLDQQPSAKESV